MKLKIYWNDLTEDAKKRLHQLNDDSRDILIATVVVKDIEDVIDEFNLFRDLDPEEEAEFRQWAKDNYTPNSIIEGLWHPVVRNECARINVAFNKTNKN